MLIQWKDGKESRIDTKVAIIEKFVNAFLNQEKKEKIVCASSLADCSVNEKMEM